MGSNDPSTQSKASKSSEQEQPPATTSGTAAPVYPEWPGFQGYSAMPPHGFFPPPVAAGQAHPYMWGAQHMVPPYGTPPPPYMMYPPGTVYAHPSTPGVHPFHYPMATNGNVEPAGAAPGAPEMNGKNEPGRTSGPSANGVTSNSESGSDGESEGSDANSQNDSHSKENDVNENGSAQNGVSQSSSHGVFNETMPLVPVQSGAVIGGVAGPATNLNIGMDYWGATGSSHVPAMRSKATSGSARGEQWDERELKKQKRKLSNRESARRSRLRKQAECEELGQRAEALKAENSSLRVELERIKKEYEELLLKNSSLKEKLGRLALLDAICRDAEEASASRNPSATPAPSPVTQYLPPAAASWPPSSSSTTNSSALLSRVPTAPHASATPLPRIPAAPNVTATSPFPLSRTPAAARASTADLFSPPRELSQRAAASGYAFSPPRELSQRPAAEEESDCQIIEAMGPASTDRARSVLPRDARAASQTRVKSLPRGRQARATESKSAQEIKRELERVLKQMNDMKNENTELKKGMKNKDLEIEAKEAEIHNLKKANLGCSSKDICSTRMDIDHTPANEALQAGGSYRTSTRRADKLNGKYKDLCSSRDGTSTSGAYLEENAHLELKSNKCMDNKAKGVQTDLPVNNEHLEHKKVPINNISSSLCAIWGRPANSMLGRSLISKILASCSEEMLTLLQSTKLPDKCENSSEGSSSMHNAISEVYDIIIKVNSDAVPVQTLLEVLLNLCVVGNVVVVGRALRILYSILQNLLTHGIKSNQRNNVIIGTNVNSNMEMESNNTLLNVPGMENLVRSEDGLHIGNMFLPSIFWPSFFTAVLQIALKYSEESIRVDALSIVILVARTSDPKVEREKFGFTSVMESLHPLLQKENGLLVKKHSVHLLFLLLNCPTMLKLLCNGGTDGSEVMEAVGSENDRSQQAISTVLQDLSECLTCEATSSLGLKLCRLVVNLLAYIASSGKLGYQVLLGSVTANGSSFLELIMEVLASQMEQEVDFSTEAHELLKERYLLMREALILLNRLASHAMFSKPTLEVLVGSGNQCASLTIDTANRLPQRSKYPLRHLAEINPQMANDLAELAQKFRSRVYGFLEEQQHSKAGRSNSSGPAKSPWLPPRVPR
ncbi:hypothetical protein ACQ4PT_070784 [Festuca glaucescens]